MIRKHVLLIAAALLGAGTARHVAAGGELLPPTPTVPAAAVRRGYLLFRSEFPDKEAIRPYGRAVVPVAARFGGRFIALADHPERVEGSPDARRVVILEFPSLQAARAFWNSPEYAAVKKLRAGIGIVDAIMFEGT